METILQLKDVSCSCVTPVEKLSATVGSSGRTATLTPAGAKEDAKNGIPNRMERADRIFHFVLLFSPAVWYTGLEERKRRRCVSG